jgi:ATP synthase F0 subunit c
LDNELIKIAAYIGGGLAMGLGAIGSAVGEGLTAGDAINGTSRQPGSRDELFRMMLVGQALAESAGVFALVIAMLMVLRGEWTGAPLAIMGSLIGAGLSVGLGGIGVGVGCGMISARACDGLARNPESRKTMLLDMLIGQAMGTTPSIFALVVSLVLLASGGGKMTWDASLRAGAAFVGSGLCMGLAAIGPGVGLGFCGAAHCDAVAARFTMQPVLRRVMLIGAAITQNMAVLAFIVSFLLMGAAR